MLIGTGVVAATREPVPSSLNQRCATLYCKTRFLTPTSGGTTFTCMRNRDGERLVVQPHPLHPDNLLNYSLICAFRAAQLAKCRMLLVTDTGWRTVRSRMLLLLMSQLAAVGCVEDAELDLTTLTCTELLSPPLQLLLRNFSATPNRHAVDDVDGRAASGYYLLSGSLSELNFARNQF